ncbi:MAG TPA: endonuclease/exonuclease/phosphatase family protein [Lutibacter sp.]|nr:endonuclease/exonuclease/phosphatase family protein [Lutibacter sp.]
MTNTSKISIIFSLIIGGLLISCGSTATKSTSTSTDFSTKQYKIRTIAFYNLENLFDTIDDPELWDERSPIMEMKGDIAKVYWNKVDNMAKVIADIGVKDAKAPPAIIGVCEIENKSVLEDLVNSKYLKKYNYSIVHYDSHDKRGIDVALLYQSRYFKPTKSKSYNVKLYDAGDRVYTRDQLLVSGVLDGEMIHLIVNHWPSRRGGEAKSRPMRVGAAKYNTQMIDSLQKMYDNPKIFGLGDYNDDPINASFKEVLQATGVKKEVKEAGIYNPMEDLFKRGFHTSGYRDNISMFDQIYMTSPALAKDNNYKKWQFYKANIFNPNYLTNPKGRYKGYPFRSFANSSFTGGYSDHYPVYIYLIREK